MTLNILDALLYKLTGTVEKRYTEIISTHSDQDTQIHFVICRGLLVLKNNESFGLIEAFGHCPAVYVTGTKWLIRITSQ